MSTTMKDMSQEFDSLKEKKEVGIPNIQVAMKDYVALLDLSGKTDDAKICSENENQSAAFNAWLDKKGLSLYVKWASLLTEEQNIEAEKALSTFLEKQKAELKKFESEIKKELEEVKSNQDQYIAIVKNQIIETEKQKKLAYKPDRYDKVLSAINKQMSAMELTYQGELEDAKTEGKTKREEFIEKQKNTLYKFKLNQLKNQQQMRDDSKILAYPGVVSIRNLREKREFDFVQLHEDNGQIDDEIKEINKAIENLVNQIILDFPIKKKTASYSDILDQHIIDLEALEEKVRSLKEKKLNKENELSTLYLLQEHEIHFTIEEKENHDTLKAVQAAELKQLEQAHINAMIGVNAQFRTNEISRLKDRIDKDTDKEFRPYLNLLSNTKKLDKRSFFYDNSKKAGDNPLLGSDDIDNATTTMQLVENGQREVKAAPLAIHFSDVSEDVALKSLREDKENATVSFRTSTANKHICYLYVKNDKKEIFRVTLGMTVGGDWGYANPIKYAANSNTSDVYRRLDKAMDVGKFDKKIFIANKKDKFVALEVVVKTVCNFVGVTSLKPISQTKVNNQTLTGNNSLTLFKNVAPYTDITTLTKKMLPDL